VALKISKLIQTRMDGGSCTVQVIHFSGIVSKSVCVLSSGYSFQSNSLCVCVCVYTHTRFNCLRHQDPDDDGSTGLHGETSQKTSSKHLLLILYKDYLRAHFSWKTCISSTTFLSLLDIAILTQIDVDKKTAHLLENTARLSYSEVPVYNVLCVYLPSSFCLWML
jgi:hypothetical protein